MAVSLDRVNRPRRRMKRAKTEKTAPGQAITATAETKLRAFAKTTRKVKKPNLTKQTANVLTGSIKLVRPRSPQRPWRKFVATPPMMQDPLLNTEDFPHIHFMPDDIENTSNTDLFQQMVQQWLADTWSATQRRSYWLSQLSYRHSWFARVQLFPRLRIPLPGWLTRRPKLDE